MVNIRDICRVHAELSLHLEQAAPAIEAIAAELTRCLASGGTVFACGNGGSASQAEHFAGELLGRFTMDRKALPVFALSQNSAVVTAVANDTGYSRVFSRQIEGLGKQGDCLIALSTSGASENVVEACRAARRNGMKVFSLTGGGGGVLGPASDIALEIPSANTARIQEMHLVVLHALCQMVEERLFSSEA